MGQPMKSNTINQNMNLRGFMMEMERERERSQQYR